MSCKFIQFGCWNNLNDNGNLRLVTNKLHQYLAKEDTNNGDNHDGKNNSGNKTDFIVVSGDNYYNDKSKNAIGKVKTILPDKLKQGIEMLSDSTNPTPIYMLLGNHDLDTNPIDTAKQNLYVLDPNDHKLEPEKSDCFIIREEMKAIQNSNNSAINYLTDKLAHLLRVFFAEQALHCPNNQKHFQLSAVLC